MLHTLQLYNTELLILRKGLAALKSHQPVPESLQSAINVKGGKKFLFSTEDMKLFYSGLSVLDYLGQNSSPAEYDNEKFWILQDRVRKELTLGATL